MPSRATSRPITRPINAARVLDSTARLLGVDHEGLADLALSAPSGAGGAALVPYFEGERTPDRPDATASLHGLTLGTWTPAAVARAAVEGLLCGLADTLDALEAEGAAASRVLLVGGGAALRAVRHIAPAVLGRPVHVPPPGEYVARGAARQAAWVLADTSEAPTWALPATTVHEAEPAPAVRERYAEARDHVLSRLRGS
jgi:xylulokinase